MWPEIAQKVTSRCPDGVGDLDDLLGCVNELIGMDLLMSDLEELLAPRRKLNKRGRGNIGRGDVNKTEFSKC